MCDKMGLALIFRLLYSFAVTRNFPPSLLTALLNIFSAVFFLLHHLIAKIVFKSTIRNRENHYRKKREKNSSLWMLIHLPQPFIIYAIPLSLLLLHSLTTLLCAFAIASSPSLLFILYWAAIFSSVSLIFHCCCVFVKIDEFINFFATFICPPFVIKFILHKHKCIKCMKAIKCV